MIWRYGNCYNIHSEKRSGKGILVNCRTWEKKKCELILIHPKTFVLVNGKQIALKKLLTTENMIEGV
jgi:hypothetical protein